MAMQAYLRFFNITKNQWHKTMKDNYNVMVGEVPSKEQVEAWDDCYDLCSYDFQGVGGMAR